MSRGRSASDLIIQAGNSAKAEHRRQVEAKAAEVGDLFAGASCAPIIDFVESPWGLKLKLFPVQRFITKLYYHQELDNTLPANPDDRIKVWEGLGRPVKYEFTEAEYLRFLYNEGRCNIGEQDHERRELLLSMGRRAGKSTMSAVFASYEIYRLLNLYNPQEYYKIAEGARIQITSVATNKDQAGILFNDVASHLSKCTYFKPYLSSNTLSHVNFRTPYDIEKYGPVNRSQGGKFVSMSGKASLRLTFKPCIAKTLRGFSNVLVIMDEVAHFQDKGDASAGKVYEALEPSLAAFVRKDPVTGEKTTMSRMVMISSPLGQGGLFYNRFDMAMRGGIAGSNMLALQAPTWEVNHSVDHKWLLTKQHADPTMFDVEFKAQFSNQVKGWIEDRSFLTNCIDPKLRPLRSSLRGQFQMGIDLGLGNQSGEGDGTAICITYSDPDGNIVLAYHEYWVAGQDWRESNPHLGNEYSTPYAQGLRDVSRLDFDAIAAWIEALCRRFHITNGLFDRWMGLPLEQALGKRGLKQFQNEHFSTDQRSKMYQSFKLMMIDQKLRLYDFPLPPGGDGFKHSAIITELLSLQAEMKSKHLMVVRAPEKRGLHDDMSDALCRAIWLSIQRLGMGHYTTPGHTPHLGGLVNRAAFTQNRERVHGIRGRGNQRALPRHQEARLRVGPRR